MTPININGKFVGDGHPTYIIAEVGINHNGDVLLAKEMVAAAWESGADAVKIQTFVTNEFLHPTHPDYKYDIDAEISHKDEQEIWDYAKSHDINLFSTPEEFKSLTFIAQQDPALIKIAAMDFNYKDLIQGAAQLQKPIILSAGMSTMEEVIQSVRWVEETGNNQYILLHCVSCYPAAPHTCNLRAIQTMKTILNCPVGFSDHTVGIHIPLAAVTLGANVIEKHFTIDKNLPGPDQQCSMDPCDLKTLIQSVREIEAAFGHGRKVPAPEEEAPRKFKRRGIYAARDLSRGEILEKKDIVFFAPSHTGSQVSQWPLMEKRTLNKNISKLKPIHVKDLA